METVAEAPEVAEETGFAWGSFLAARLVVPVAVTLLGAVLTAVAVPFATDRWQNHQQAIELRTSLAREMSTSFAAAVTSIGFVVRGQIYSPSSDRSEQVFATQSAYVEGLREWTVARAQIGAELAGRFPDAGVAAAWHAYGEAVRDYYRLGSVSRDRSALLARLSEYVRGADVSWTALERKQGFKSDPAYLAAFDALGEWLLRRGDALVTRVLSLDPVV